MSGLERAMFYRLASETGLHANEFHSLTRSSFSLDTDPPFACVKGAYSKRRRIDTLPLRRDTVEQLCPFLANQLPAARAFNIPTSDKTAKMLRQEIRGSTSAVASGRHNLPETR